MSEKKSGDHNIADLRQKLFETLDAVKSGALDLDRARLVNELGKTLIDSAKVEVDFLRVTEETKSDFLSPPKRAEDLPNGITGIRQHRIAG
jgi:hypothetical protein